MPCGASDFFSSREKIETKVVAIEKVFDDSESGKQLEKLRQLFEELCKVVRDAGLDECGSMAAFINISPLFEKAMKELATDKLLDPDSLERQLLSSICQFTFMKKLPLVEQAFKIKSIVHNIDSVESSTRMKRSTWPKLRRGTKSWCRLGS